MIGNDIHVAMRRKNATWNIAGSSGEVPFAIGSADNADQVSGTADWMASVLSAQDAADWAAPAWKLIGQKYAWFKAKHLDGDPVILKLKPKTFSLLRYDGQADSLWRTTISIRNCQWCVDEHAAKTGKSTRSPAP
jgi:hypothetical protein